MYGYVRTHTPELKVREQEYYRAAYCGLCRSLGKCTGQCSRLTLSYDFTFFALVRMAIEGEKPMFRARRCPAHPLHKRPMMEPCDTLALCSYASAILGYHKVMDDRRDEKGRKRVGATFLTPYVGSLRRRAVKRGYADMDDRVNACLTDLSALEAAHPRSVDEPAELFGALMSDLLAYRLDGERAKIARAIGRHVGRWIYIVDAADDFDEDIKCGRYNPLACLWQSTDMNDTRRDELHVALLGELMGVERAMDLITFDAGSSDLSGVLYNILYEGMPATARRILFDRRGACHSARTDGGSVTAASGAGGEIDP